MLSIEHNYYLIILTCLSGLMCHECLSHSHPLSLSLSLSLCVLVLCMCVCVCVCVCAIAVAGSSTKLSLECHTSILKVTRKFRHPHLPPGGHRPTDPQTPRLPRYIVTQCVKLAVALQQWLLHCVAHTHTHTHTATWMVMQMLLPHAAVACIRFCCS